MKKNNLKLQYVISDFNENLAGGNDPLTPSFDVIENYYLEKNKFLENATGNKVMERVNIRTGKAYVSQFVYGVNGNRLPFNLSLTYNPYFYDKTEIFDDLTTNGKSGFLPAKGWKFNYQQYLRKQYNYYYYYDQNFELHKFAPALGDSSIYYDSTGQTGLTLKEVLTDGSTAYEITDGKNTTLTFNAQGALVKITEKRGANAIDLTITYNQDVTRITSITDGANRTFNFVYDTQGSILIKQGETNVIGTTITAEKILHTVYYVKEDDNIYFDYASTDFIMPKCLIGIKNLISYDTTTITIDESTKKVSSLSNYKYGVANEDYLTTTLSFTYKAKRTNLCSYTKTTNDVIISNTNHYYFAQNGELIYTVTDDPTPEGGEQTLADKAIEFLDANTFATAKAFNNSQAAIEEKLISNEQQKNEVITFETDDLLYKQKLGNDTEIWWYKNKKVNLKCGDITVGNVDFTIKDYFLTIASHMKNSACFNVWYNNAKNMIANVSDAKICYSEGQEYNNLTDCKMGILTTNEKTTRPTIVTYIDYVIFDYYSNVYIYNYVYYNEEYQYEKYSFDNNLTLTEQRDINGIVTAFTSFDGNGNCTKTKVYYENDYETTNVITYTTSYSDEDNVSSETEYYDSNSNTTSYEYNDNSELIKTILPNGQVIEHLYESYMSEINTSLGDNFLRNRENYLDGNVSTYDDQSCVYEFNYDKFNNVKAFKANYATIIESNTYYNTDKSGHVEITYANGYVERRYFDKYGRVIYVKEVVSETEENLLITYIYADSIPEEIDLITEPNDSRLTITAQSKLIKTIDKSFHKQYNGIEYGNENTHRVDYIYNGGQILEINYSTSNAKTISALTVEELDEIDRLKQKSFTRGSEKLVNSVNYKNKFSNELIEEQVELIVSDQTKGRLTTSYQKDSLLRPIKTIIKDNESNGFAIEYEYVPHVETYRTPRPNSQTIKTTVGTTPYIAKIKTYDIVNGEENSTPTKEEVALFDANGNLTALGNNTYVYDGINRLTRENNADLNKSFTYEYDALGNIKERKEFAYTTGTLGEQTLTESFSYSGNNQHQISELYDKNILYDNYGNPTNWVTKVGNALKETTLTWEGKNLVSINETAVTAGTPKYIFGYEPDGKLKHKLFKSGTTNGSFMDDNLVYHYFYDGNRLVAANYNLTNNYYFLYNAQGVIGMYDRTRVYSFRKNAFGDVVAIYDGATCVAQYKYDAWGNHTVYDGNGNVLEYNYTNKMHIAYMNPFRYRGYLWDNDVRMYYLQTRWYDPAIGRFISPDSFAYLDPTTFGGLNLYAYCYNNPITYYDPSGHGAIAIIVATLIGIVIGLVGTAIVDYADNEKFDISAEIYVTNALAMGLVGLLIGIIGPMSSTITIPTLNLMQLTTGATVLVAGTTTVVVSGWAVVGLLTGVTIIASQWIPGSWPGDDPTIPPGDGFEWSGKLPIGGDKGAWINRITGDSLHPDLQHPEPIGQHWDWINKLRGIFKRIFK